MSTASGDLRILTEDALQRVVSSSNEVPKGILTDPRLEEGKILPNTKMKNFKPETMACVPIEEIDPAYQGQKTFVVVGKKGTIHRFSARDSFTLFSPLSPIRKISIRIMTQWAFSAFMVAVVMINTILLACGMNNGFDYACTAIYIFELLLNAISRGVFVDSFTCLRSPWTWLDIVVIITSLIRPFGIYTILQWLRVFKIIPLVTEVKNAFNFLLQAITRLGSAIFLAIFWIMFFGIIGLQCYMGVLTQKCIKDMAASDPSLAYDLNQLWLENANNKSNWYVEPGQEDNYYICGNASGSSPCPEGYTCLQGFGSNPAHGYLNFDSYGWSLLQVAQAAEQDFVEYPLNLITKASGQWHIVYFTLIFFFTTFGICTFVYAILGEYFFEVMETKETRCSDGNQIQPDFSDGEMGVYQKKLKSIVNHFAFEVVITLAIILHIISLSVDNADPYYFEYGTSLLPLILSYLSYLILAIYAAEFILKVCALGPKAYFKNGWNVFDFVILLHLTVITIISNPFLNVPLVIFKLVPRWSTLQLTFQIIYESFKNLWGYAFLSGIVWTFFALWGKDEFSKAYSDGEKLSPDDDLRPRWHLMDYPHSFIMVFRSWAGETIESIWDCMLVSGVECLIYFPIVSFTGSLILMTLTLGVVYTTVKTLEARELQTNQKDSTLRRIFNTCWYPCARIGNTIRGQETGDGNKIEEIPMIDDENEKNVKPSTEPSTPIHEYRKKMQTCFDSRVMNGISIFVIVVTSLAMAFENAHNKTDLTIQTIMFLIDFFFTTFFGLMSLYQLITFGVKTSLSSLGWIFDVVLVLEMILHLSLNLQNYLGGYEYSLLFFIRSLRPFMLTSRIDRLGVVIRGIITEFGFLWKFILAGIFVWLYFNLRGMTLFGFSFYKCTHPEFGTTIYDHTKENCLTRNYSWENSVFNYDDVAQGFLSLSLVASRIGWIEILHDSFDSTGIGSTFIKENTLSHFTYFLTFFIFGVFFLFSILFGVLYYQLKKEKFSGLFFTKDQINARESASAESSDSIIPKPENATRGKIYEVINSPKFESVVMIVILLDNAVLTVDHFHMPYGLMDTLQVIRLVIFLFYLVEMILKIIGWGKCYFQSSWNRFDCWVVISSTLDLVIMDLIAKYFIDITFFRLFRIFRLFQFKPFMSRMKTISRYFKALSIAKPALWNIIMVECILMFSYSIAGMSIFGNVKLRHGLDLTFNFQSFASAVGVIFTMSSFSGFDTILKALTAEYDCSLSDLESKTAGDCGHGLFGTFFIFLYLFISFVLILNLYFVFIMEIAAQLRESRISTAESVGKNDRIENKNGIEEPIEQLQSVDIQNNHSDIVSL